MPSNPDYRDKYWDTCLCCGSNENVTEARLIPANSTADYSFLRDGYSSEFQPQSPRNRIPLCGTLGTNGTCHDYFDRHKLTLIYNPLSRKYIFYSTTLIHFNGRNGNVHSKFLPYRRVIVWRARRDSSKNSDFNLLNIAQIGADATPSELGAEEDVHLKKRRKITGSDDNNSDSWTKTINKPVSNEKEAQQKPTRAVIKLFLKVVLPPRFFQLLHLQF
jgi:hypothetical protein